MIEIEGNGTPKDTGEEKEYLTEDEIFAEEPEFLKTKLEPAEEENGSQFLQPSEDKGVSQALQPSEDEGVSQFLQPSEDEDVSQSLQPSEDEDVSQSWAPLEEGGRQNRKLTEEEPVRPSGKPAGADGRHVPMPDGGDTEEASYRARGDAGTEKASPKDRLEEIEIPEVMLEAAMTQEQPARRDMKSKRKKRPEKKQRDEGVVHSLKEYKDKLSSYRTKKWIRYAVIALLVLVIVLVVSTTVRNWKYTSYSVLVTDTKEDTLSFEYCGVGERILKYGVDSATMTDRNNNTIWNVSYTMQSPAVAVCGSTIAIYDKNGTDICICDETGQIGTVSANMPIVKATVARQGVVAAIMEDGDNTWIQYYDKSGSNISTIKTTIDSPGYPMDLSLSDDGMLLAVSYLYFENGTPKTRIYFYNFGSVGQNQMDNRVSGYEYSDTIIPQLEYLDSSTCVAFREDGFTIFGGAQIPEERKEITVDQEIVSTFYDESHIGLVLNNEDSEKAFQLIVYNKNGREILREDTDFAYQEIELVGNQIVMYNKSAFCVYNLSGVEKFNGSLNDLPRQFFSIGQNRFVLNTEDSFNLIKLG